MSTTRETPQIRRFKELYFPTTYTFQIWLALLAFAVFIFTSCLRFVAAWWDKVGISCLNNSISKDQVISKVSGWDIALGVVGTLALLGGAFAFLSLLCIAIRSVIGVKKAKPKELPKQITRDEMVTAVNDIMQSHNALVAKYLDVIDRLGGRNDKSDKPGMSESSKRALNQK